MITYYRTTDTRRVCAIFRDVIGVIVVDFEFPDRIRVIDHDRLTALIPFVKLK